MTTTLPNLAGVATADLVEKISGSGNFSASYINWSRTLNLLREHAPGWMPEVVPNDRGGLLHQAPVGAYLLIRFRNGDDLTPAMPQAVMDHRNAAIPLEKITARDITDTHRRGICMAAAMTFGLAYELWAKLPLETGYAERDEEPAAKAAAKPEPKKPEPIKPTSGAKDLAADERKPELDELALTLIDLCKSGQEMKASKLFYVDSKLENDERVYVWDQLQPESKVRRAIKDNDPRVHA